MRFVRLGVTTVLAALVFCAPAFGAGAPVTREVIGVAEPDDALFASSVEESGTVYVLDTIEWTERFERNRSVWHEVEYDFGAQVGQVEPPATLDALYHDRVTGVTVDASLRLERLVSAGASTRGREIEVFVHTSYDTAAYELTPEVLARFDAPAPQIAGAEVSQALLEALHYDPAVYRLVEASWTGPIRKDGDKTVREASYTVERIAEVQRAVYGGDVALPDVLVHDGIATYRAPTVVEAVTKTAAEAVETVADDPTSLVPWIVAGGVAATTILGAVFYWRRRRRRALDEDDISLEPGDAEMEGEDA
ncbi:MAG: hypothetical protein XD74_2104 [Actinobacteria bacterium 66_15]|nr:MAG: hypothetical protein XD74_2104 [Actinobacteria bacterium 66_15]